MKITFICWRNDGGRWSMEAEWPLIPRVGEMVELPELGSRRVEDVCWTQLADGTVQVDVRLLEPSL